MVLFIEAETTRHPANCTGFRSAYLADQNITRMLRRLDSSILFITAEAAVFLTRARQLTALLRLQGLILGILSKFHRVLRPWPSSWYVLLFQSHVTYRVCYGYVGALVVLSRLWLAQVLGLRTASCCPSMETYLHQSCNYLHLQQQCTLWP